MVRILQNPARRTPKELARNSLKTRRDKKPPAPSVMTQPKAEKIANKRQCQRLFRSLTDVIPYVRDTDWLHAVQCQSTRAGSTYPVRCRCIGVRHCGQGSAPGTRLLGGRCLTGAASYR